MSKLLVRSSQWRCGDFSCSALVLDVIGRVSHHTIENMVLTLVGKRLMQSAAPRMSRTALLSTSAVASPPAASAPSVKDVTIGLTFIDPSGARRKVPGLVGT